ncbi:electron transfer flavoprotein subunit alpha/FixB family protein [Marinomonas pollencensis]|uniref:Electron transfer flavoprotein subunit alpha n=1 Tax=Marinomonas pollencensis TaxID=491954 RepID=A0A3E0DS43_9GAMM|nr:FAD-binding protein [Marinomonas pollencensis]REG85898.1 electron transfer flavoprotein alpha subunit apoprotein [Marinomonas pollencensis]
MTILVIAEHNNQALAQATANTLTAAQDLASKTNSEVVLLVAGQACQSVVEEAASTQGVAKVLVADCAALKQQLAENVAPLVVDLVKQENITHVLLSSTAAGKNIAPRVAALLDVAQISDLIEVIDADTFVRPIYAGNALATIKSSDGVKVLTVRSTAFEAVEFSAGDATIQSLPEAAEQGLSRFISEEVVASDRPELTSAKVIISGGRGMKNGDNFVLLEKVADKIGAAVGASRAAVDAGFVSNDMQVGQTGKIVAPDLYIAVGISGAIQHLAGMKDSKIIVAINTDEEAPIFNVADYGLQADLFDVLPEFEAAL